MLGINNRFINSCEHRLRCLLSFCVSINHVLGTVTHTIQWLGNAVCQGVCVVCLSVCVCAALRCCVMVVVGRLFFRVCVVVVFVFGVVLFTVLVCGGCFFGLAWCW